MTHPILCPIDGTDHATHAIETAADLATKSGAKLLLCVVNVAHGAAVLTCDRCNNRQAISGARFAHFVRRVQHGLIPVVGDIPQAPGAGADEVHLQRPT